MKEEPKEYVSLYLPQSQAKRLKELENKDNFILEYIEETKRSLKDDIADMDEDIIQYKAYMISAREKFKKAKEEMLSANYTMWEEFDKDSKSLNSKVSEMVNSLSPLSAELKKITDQMKNIDNWEIEKFLDMVTKLQTAMFGSTGDLLQFLLNNYKRPTS